MEGVLRQLGDNARGVWVLLGLLFALMVIVNWWFWLLGRGRFSRPGGPGDRSTVAHYVGTFVGQVIIEFRHLLALVVVTLFAVTMATVIVLARDDFEKVKAGVQLVAASLGGLIGSIIGYYFGESAARQRAADLPAATAPALVQQPPPGPGQLPPAAGAPPVSPVQPPPQAGTLR